MIQQLCIEVPFLGKFLKHDHTVKFAPALELLTLGRFILTDSESLIGPISKPASLFSNSKPISLTKIS